MKTKLLLFLILPVLMFASQSFAYDILSGGGFNEVYFQNVELLFDSNGNQIDLSTQAGVDRGIVKGDVFMGIINAQNVDVSGSPYWQYDSTSPDAINVSGVFAQEVVATPDSSGLIYLTNTSLFNFTLLDSTTVDISTILSAGEMMALYVDTDTDGSFTAYNTNGTVQEDIAAATDSDTGAAWLTAGIAAQTDYSYSFATLGLILGEFSAEAYSGLSVVQNNTGFSIFELVNDDGEDLFDTDVQIAFTSEIEENNQYSRGNSPWQLASNDPAIMQPVPEPSTFLLLGAGLMGLGYYSRKRRK